MEQSYLSTSFYVFLWFLEYLIRTRSSHILDENEIFDKILVKEISAPYNKSQGMET